MKMKKVPFNRDLFNKLGGIDKCRVEYEDGIEAIIHTTNSNAHPDYPVVASPKGSMAAHTYTADGCRHTEGNVALFILAPGEERIRPWKPREGLGKWVKEKFSNEISLLVNYSELGYLTGTQWHTSVWLLNNAEEYDIKTHQVIGPCGVKEVV